MNKSLITETILVTGLVALVFVTIDPFDYHMSHMWYMALCGIITAVYFFVVFFVWGEKYHDEREFEHRYFSSRAAYITGSTVLILSILIQSFVSMVDPWLPTTLASMFVAKLIARIYSEKYK